MAAVLLTAMTGCGSDPPEAPASTKKLRPAAIPAGPVAPNPRLSQLTPLPVAAVPQASEVAPGETLSPGPAPIASFPPKDECAALPGFAAFRAALFGAIRKRDAVALADLANPAINLDFGGGSGTDELRKRLIDTPSLWGELAALEALGCAEDGGVVTLPWIFSRVPDSVDAYRTMLVTGRNVRLRAKPAANGTELANLDWALVEAASTAEPVASRSGYREVAMGPKERQTRGFVTTSKLRGLLDYRLIADRQDGEWKITAFVAGD